MRFGYHEDWKNISLLEIVEKISRKADENSNAPIRMISYGNGFILQSDKYSRNNAGQSLKNYTLLKHGEMAYNHGASKNKPYGVCYALTESEEARVPFVYHTFKFTRGLYKFWNYALNLNQIDKQLKKLVSSGARMDGLLNISYEDYTSIKINEPSLSEQQKIIEFLSKIDERIDTQSKIIEKLQSQMLAIYHQVFSQLNSEVLPLVKLCSIQKGAQVNGIELLENGPYYFMNGGIVPSGFYNDWNTETNTISISEGGNSCGYVQYNKERFWSGGHCYTLQKLNKVSVRYLYHFLKSHEKDIMCLRIGTGLPNIQKKDLEQFLIKVPSLLEQERLVKLLDSFELKIGTEEKIFKKYKEQKKFLLSNMFI